MIFYLSFLLAEPVFPHADNAIHPLPILLYNVRHFETPQHIIWTLGGKMHVVEIVDNYIIGVILRSILFPLMTPGADPNSLHERVKVYVHNDIANRTVPILEDDPINKRFFLQIERTPEKYFRFVELVH